MPNIKKLVELAENHNQQGLAGQLDGFSFSHRCSDAKKLKAFFNKPNNVTVSLLFIDIEDFVKNHLTKNVKDLSKLLDKYYQTVTKIIHEHNGTVEKLIGDGIICVFGKPFFNDTIDKSFKNAFNCAKKVIKTCKSKGFPVKIAFHSGKIMYYKPKSEVFEEYTMIGEALAKLYRLESVGKVNCIVFDDKGYKRLVKNFQTLTPANQKKELAKIEEREEVRMPNYETETVYCYNSLSL
ncbi:MAG: adenylate/guanylate cyclase domain-containing protein [Bacteroidia bacterium]